MKTWLKWLDAVRYTSAVQAYLEQQRHVFASIVNAENYSTIIEAGCADGSFLFPTIVALKRHYCGIDIEPQAIAALAREIAVQPRGLNLNAVCADMRDVAGTLRQHDIPLSSSLVVFPFNALGVMDDPKGTLEQIGQLGLDVLVFTYRTTPQAQHLRQTYYNNLGFSNLVAHEDATGIFFGSDDGLATYAFHPPVITCWLKAPGTTAVSAIEFSDLGVAFFAKHTRGSAPATLP